jgi:cytochrome c oxidase subunit 2
VVLCAQLAFIPTWLMPPDASAHGPALDRLMGLSLWLMLALFALLHLLAFIGLALQRRDQPRTSKRTKLLVEYLPILAFAILFGYLTVRAERLWATSRYVGPDPSALQVEVVGVQFAWYFRYPGADATFGRARPELIAPGEGNPLGIDPGDPSGNDDFVSSELVLPAGREVDLRLHAQDVIHGFAVPAMRIEQNVVPGQNLHIHFTPTQPGTYAILCNQLCGLGHFHMTANLRVLSPEEYTAWLASKEAAHEANSR